MATEPKNFAEATTGKYLEEWTESVTEEYDALMDHHVWNIVPLPPNQTVVGSQCHNVHKLGPTGEIIRRKSRFVVNGFY